MKKLKLILRSNMLFLILFLFLSLYVLVFINLPYHSKYKDNTKIISGKITALSLNGNLLKFDLKGKEKIKVTYYLDSIDEKNNILNKLHLGDEIKLQGILESPDNNTIPHTFNYQKYLYYNHIYYTFKADSYEVIKSSNNPFYQLKDYLLKRIYQSPYNDYLLIFILGDKALISSEDYSLFQINGTAHLLAISGMHLSLILLILNKLLFFMNEKTRFFIICFVLLLLGFLTSFSASILRVIIFYILNYVKKLKKLNYSSLHILFLTAFILLIINPFYIFNYGFLYSLIITGGIIYYQDSFHGSYLKQLFLISLISFLFSLPITVSLNYEINLLSILFNLIIVPLVSFIIYPLALFTLIFPNSLFGYSIELLNFLNRLGYKFNLIITIPKLSIFIIMLYYLILIMIKNKPKLVVLLISLIIIAKYLPKVDGNLYVYYLDVGQGDSELIISPHQKEVIMLDTGGKVSFAKASWQESTKKYNLIDNTLKLLKSLGISKLDYLILSHGDYDHAKEALNLINNTLVKKVIFNNDAYNTLENEIINLLKKENIPYYQNMRKLKLTYFDLYFLKTKIYANENDNSNIVYFNYLKQKFLFMGDASTEVEDNLIKKYNLNDMTVLKVGHHGSKTSSSASFINKINPKYAIISVGKNNRYNHPNEEVLNNLYSAIVYRTDLNGSITFKISKKKTKISLCPP